MNNLMAVHLPVVGQVTLTYTALRGLQITDVWEAGNAATAGTVQPRTIVAPAAVTNVLSGGGTIATAADQRAFGSYHGGLTTTAAQLTLAAGDSIVAVGSAAGTDADVYFEVIPTSWISG